MAVSTISDIEAIEGTPLAARALPQNTYAALAAGARRTPDASALTFFMSAESLSAHMHGPMPNSWARSRAPPICLGAWRDEHDAEVHFREGLKMAVSTISDIEAIEGTPLAARALPQNTYAALADGAADARRLCADIFHVSGVV